MHLPPGTGSASYAAAGVDVDAGERAVEALRPYAEKAGRPEVLGGIGGFAGLFAPRLGRYREPVLAASTDGVGTKVAIAQAVDKHDTIGLDLVAMTSGGTSVTVPHPWQTRCTCSCSCTE